MQAQPPKTQLSQFSSCKISVHIRHTVNAHTQETYCSIENKTLLYVYFHTMFFFIIIFLSGDR